MTIWTVIEPWVAPLGGVGAVLLLGLGAWRWRVERRLREREVRALERQARAMEERNELMRKEFP